jgi:hypothetical protein
VERLEGLLADRLDSIDREHLHEALVLLRGNVEAAVSHAGVRRRSTSAA